MAKAKKKTKSTSGAALASDPCCHPTAADKKRQEEWRAEDDARTLTQAAAIREDKPRLARAKAWARKRADELKNITSITD